MSDPHIHLTRRNVLHAAGLTIAVVATSGGMFVLPANAALDDMRAAMLKYTGGAEPKSDRVTLTMAEVAENGATVPFAVSVQSPMTPQDYVKAIYIMADNNPAPDAISFQLTHDCVAEVSGRIRLARTQSVYALAVMSDGSSHFAKSEIKVTIGGCGG